jgi:hypothetical protein
MKHTKKLATLVTALGVAAAMHSSAVVAEPNQARIITYYSDATMSVEVGEGGNGCHASYMYGEQTPYYTIEYMNCS